MNVDAGFRTCSEGDGELIVTRRQIAHRGDSIDDRPAAEKLIGTVEEIQESFVFDCSLVECYDNGAA